MAFGFSYTFPAIRGTQAGQDYYVAMCPLKLLPRIFLFDESSVPAELRAQRNLNTARVPEIKRYIIENMDSYAFSAITASIDGDVRFEAAAMSDDSQDVGLLIVPMSAKFIINDGQHRRAAIEAALEEQPELGDETIAVVLYLDTDLKRSQQLFADLNQHAQKPSKSISILYEQREPLALLARDLANNHLPFKGLTEMEKTSISNRSIYFFTLSAIYQATGALLNKKKKDKISENEEVLARSYWKELLKVLPEWQQVVKKDVRSNEIRRDFVHAHAVTLHAFGMAGRTLLQEEPKDWKKYLKKLKAIDWRKANTSLWEGRAMSGGQMSKARQNVQLTTNLIKSILELSLSPEEQKLEDKFQNTQDNSEGEL